MESLPHLDANHDAALDKAVADIGNVIYANSGLFEDLENSGHIRANGHHLRQQLAEYAQKLVREAWAASDDSLTQQ